MKAYLVALLLIAEVIFVSAQQKDDTSLTKVKKLGDSKDIDLDIVADGKLTEAQKRRDPGYYYSRPNRYQSSHGFGRHEYRGRIVTRLQSQINRPFNQYGPPDHGSQGNNHYQPSTANNIVHQETPEPIRQTEFAEESPIASQNNQPFGQHTANYLPPSNQKLPANNPPHLFSNQNHDFPRQQVQQQFEQLQFNENNQNFENQDLINFNQNQFTNQQISDAAHFLTQNAQAISNLYGAPAPNQNYAPHNEEFDQQQLQQGQQSENLQTNSGSGSQGFQGQLPSYASGVLNTQDTFERQSIEKDRIIAQLQQTISDRETSGRNVHHFSSNTFQHNEFPSLSQQLQIGTGTSSFNHQSSSFFPSSTISSVNYQGYYEPSVQSTTPQAPVSPPANSATNAPLQAAPGNTHITTSLPAQNSLRPAIVNSGFPQYGGFVPTFVSSNGFVPTYGTTFLSTAPVKPAENSPTHFGIPIPTFQDPKPVQPPNTIPVTTNPAVNPTHPNRPTISIPLGPVNSFVTPVQTPVIKPVVPVGTPVIKPVVPIGTPVYKPVVPVGPSVIKPIIPAATPVHPTYGVHPFVYRPVKVYPVYYYPNSAYHSSHKPLIPAASSHPWSYASQAKPVHIWK